MRVIFPLIKAVDSNMIVYPDDSSLFSNTEIVGEESMAADYAGVLDLPRYVASVVREPLSLFAFRGRFSVPEKRAIYTAAVTNVDARIWLDDLNAAAANDPAVVDLDNPDFIAQVVQFEHLGLIAVGRAAEILA
jgi:hypothetical protein